MPTSLQTLRVTRSLSPVSTLTVTPCLPERGDGFGGGVLGRVEEREIAGQDQVAFVGFGKSGLVAQFFGGDGQHAETVLAQFINLLHQIADEDRFHRENLALAFKMRAFGEDRLRRALGQQLPFAIRAFDGHGHHAARKVERDFVHHFVFFDAEFAGAVPCNAARRGRGRFSGRSGNG